MGSKSLAFVLSLIAVATLSAQEPPPTDPSAQTPAPVRFGVPPPELEPQPYDKVITKDAKTRKGVFTVHQVKEKFFYEIPKEALDKEFLWNTQIARTVDGAGYGGQALSNRVVRWEMRGNKVHLRYMSYNVVADPKTPIAQAVTAANNDTIIMTFAVAFAKDGDPVIEVTRLFTGDVTNSARASGSAPPTWTRRAPSSNASLRIRKHRSGSHRYLHTHRGAGPGAPTPAPTPVGRRHDAPGSATVVLHHSMVKLPEKPMMPRALRRTRRLLHHHTRSTTAGTNIRPSASATSPAGAWKRRTPAPPSPSR